MTTYVRAPEAARRLGVTLNTLYAYVSRGRIERSTASDGRTSLFDLDEVDALRARSQRRPPEPPPSIDVRIATGVTHLDEAGVRYRGHQVVDLIDRDFETIAELVWTGHVRPERPTNWRPVEIPVRPVDALSNAELIRVTLDVDEAVRRDVGEIEPVDLGRTLLASIPAAFGSPIDDPTTGLAHRLAGCWHDRPDTPFVSAIDATLMLLADHELATSTLAARVATSSHASAAMSVVAGLATVSGALHGGATAEAARLIDSARTLGVGVVIDDLRRSGRRIPGFGHSIYRNTDPRFELLLERIAMMSGAEPIIEIVEALIIDASTRIAKAPNIDLGVGALLVTAGLDVETPLFAIARIAGWIAHHLEELDERPLRFRGLAR